MYKFDGPGTKARAGVRLRALKTARIRVGMLFPLVKAPVVALASLSLPIGGKLLRKLWQVYDPAICLAGLISKISVTSISSKRAG